MLHAHVKTLRSKADIDRMICESAATSDTLVIKFHAPWCEPCKMMAPWFNSLAETHHASAKFVEMNVDLDDEAAQDNNIKLIPVVHLWHAGSLVGMYGREATGDLEKELLKCISQKTPEIQCCASPEIQRVVLPALQILRPERSLANPKMADSSGGDIDCIVRDLDRVLAELDTIAERISRSGSKRRRVVD